MLYKKAIGNTENDLSAQKIKYHDLFETSVKNHIKAARL
jgi:hypothetical protein